MTDNYTAYIPVDDIERDDLVIARGLTAVEAMKIAFGYEDAWKTRLAEEDFGSFVHYAWQAHSNKSQPLALPYWTLHATVLKTQQPDADRVLGMDMIAAQFRRFSRRFWSGRVESDEAFDNRLKRGG
ncbi:hypothetical protein ACVIGB_005222 [Bradyrhizobium sp. USDA 4341]